MYLEFKYLLLLQTSLKQKEHSNITSEQSITPKATLKREIKEEIKSKDQQKGRFMLFLFQ